MVNETNELINKELGIFPFLNFNNIEEIKNKVENLKKLYPLYKEFLIYFSNQWIQFFENKMLFYNRVPKKIRTFSFLENYNGLLLKAINKKKFNLA